MNVLKAYPTKTLKDIFKSYHFCSIEQQELQKNTGIVIEDGLFEFSFVKEKDILIKHNSAEIELPQAFGFGKLPKPYKLIIPSTLTYFTIKLQPWVSSFFFPKGIASITDLSETLYSDIYSLHCEIFNSNSFEEQIKHAELFFSKQILPDVANTKISRYICNYIYQNNGNVIIRDMLSQFSYSRQKINQLFFDQTNNSIKEFALYTRLRAIMTYRTNNPQESLTNITYKFGYFDQSHFIKDMKKITGVTPSKFSKSKNFFYEQLKIVR
ncbi:helix-turn-helix domain-containing protein [Aquimarina sp. AU119]|uniref:helix-turn-helix domain-containing protein n=1 Tax=Aquimarina sp. AU119 TaxID=2108528 RepID=UPI000D68E658|nr:helix-turn-helix domain-containing protein [Aquimarina sp. AU119]